MEEIKTIELKSGAELKISASSFDVAKALYQAVCEEMKDIKIESMDEAINLGKDLLCMSLSSKKIDACVAECLKRCTYNGVRIIKENNVFESVKAREDYIEVLFEVAKENLAPFTKNLSALYSAMLGLVQSSQA